MARANHPVAGWAWSPQARWALNTLETQRTGTTFGRHQHVAKLKWLANPLHESPVSRLGLADQVEVNSLVQSAVQIANYEQETFEARQSPAQVERDLAAITHRLYVAHTGLACRTNKSTERGDVGQSASETHIRSDVATGFGDSRSLVVSTAVRHERSSPKYQRSSFTRKTTASECTRSAQANAA